MAPGTPQAGDTITESREQLVHIAPILGGNLSKRSVDRGGAVQRLHNDENMTQRALRAAGRALVHHTGAFLV